MRLRDGVSAGFGIAALGVSVFAIGGADRWAQALVSILVGGAIAPQLVSRRGLGRLSPLLLLSGLAIALCLLQLVPLPSSLLDALDPTGNALREDGVELLGLHPWRAISLDAPGTLRAACFFTVLLGIALIALRGAVTERGRYRLLAGVALTCGLVAVVVGIHELLGATKLYGLYSLKEAKPSVLGPLLNENHLGCLMALGTMTAIGLVMYRRQSSLVRAGWLFVVAGCGATTVASQSRGATVALVIGIMLVLAVRLAQKLTHHDQSRAPRRRFSVTSLPLVLVAASAVVVIVYASAGSVSDQLERTNLTNEVTRPKSKFVAWQSATELVRESPFVGIGRGALEPVFTRVHPASSLATYSHLENEYIEALVDWGVLGATALGLVLVWMLWTAARRWRDGPLAAGALGGIVVVLIQSNVDFGIELLGVAVPTTIVAATLCYVPLVELSGRRLATQRVLRGAAVLALAAAAALLMSRSTTTLAEDHAVRRLSSIEEIRPGLDRHPLDYFGYAQASEVMVKTGDKNSVRLLNHAMTLHPTHAGLHLRAAHLLLAANRPDQATVEYASALRGSADPQKIVGEIVATLLPQQAANAIPLDHPRLEEILSFLNEQGRQDVQLLVLYRILAQGSTSHVCDQLYTFAIQRKDAAIVKKAAERCTDFDPNHDVREQLAELLLTVNANDDAIRLLSDVESWDGRIDEKRNAWLTLCDAYVQQDKWQEGRHCLHRLERAGLVDDAHANEIVRRIDRINKSETPVVPPSDHR